MTELRLGQLLVESGVLTGQQVDHIVSVQEKSGEPFGLLAERLCGVDPQKIEEAWAKQYAGLTRTVDPDVEVYDNEASGLVTRRQAWQFRILPLRFEGRELLIATTQQHLRRDPAAPAAGAPLRDQRHRHPGLLRHGQAQVARPGPVQAVPAARHETGAGG
ncbi:MAG: hypothetical protein ACYTBR_12625 [Planctomycetota bacterium]|jgi:hypothetical protein